MYVNTPRFTIAIGDNRDADGMPTEVLMQFDPEVTEEEQSELQIAVRATWMLAFAWLDAVQEMAEITGLDLTDLTDLTDLDEDLDDDIDLEDAA